MTCRSLVRRARVAWRWIDASGVQISQTVDGAMAMPSFTSSPWIRRWPHSGFSRARRSTSRLMPG